MGEVIIIVLGSLASVCVLAWAAVEIASISTRWRARREIMAYVAEGTMSPEDAARLIELAERADLRRKVLATADWDDDWERWRDTVREVFGEGAEKVATKPKERPVGA